jgi:hypothetical protein
VVLWAASARFTLYQRVSMSLNPVMDLMKKVRISINLTSVKDVGTIGAFTGTGERMRSSCLLVSMEPANSIHAKWMHLATQ